MSPCSCKNELKGLGSDYLTSVSQMMSPIRQEKACGRFFLAISTILCESIKLKRNSWRVFVIVKVSVKYILTTHKPTKAIKTLAVFVALKTSFYVDYDVGKKLSTGICVSHLLWTKGKRDYSLPKLIRHTSFKRLK